MNVLEHLNKKLATLSAEIASPLPTDPAALTKRFAKSDLHRKLLAVKAKMSRGELTLSKWV